MAAWLRPRAFRSARNRNNSGEEILLQLDLSKDLSQTVRDVLWNVVKRDDLTINRRLKYLSAFVKICEKLADDGSFVDYTTEEVFRCLRIPLFHDAREVRAAGLRAMRYLLRDERSVEAFLAANCHHFVCRSLDIILDNHIERIQAMRLVRKVLNVCAAKFPSAFVKCLVAVVNDGAQERDRLLRACLATLSELALLNLSVCVDSGVVGSLLRSSLTCSQPRINEALIATILYLLNQPKTRRYVHMGVDLEQVLAPYTDCHFRPPVEVADYSGEDKDSSFAASRLALLSILRSWPGMIRLCKPNDSGMKSLINVLYLPKADIRKGVIDLLLELLRLPVPDWTDNFSVALCASDSLVLQDDWKLYEGFVAKEGCDILAYISENRINLIDNCIALLLLALIHNGILEALVEVILTGDNFLSVRATFLLGEFLHLADRFLPHECSHHSYCLPTLVAVAVSFDTDEQQRHVASAAVTYLNCLHSLKKRGPLPCSLFLDQLIQFSPRATEFRVHSGRTERTALLSSLRKETDDSLAQSIKDSQVTNSSKEFHDWDWPLVGAILKLSGKQLRRMDDNLHRQFVRRLVHFFKPTSKLFSKVDGNGGLRDERARAASLVGCHLMDFLVEAIEDEATKYLEEFLVDFGLCLGQITAERSPSDAIFSPNRVLSSHCQDYFLFVGRLSRSNRGRKSLERTSIYQYVLDLVTVTSHDCYIKLIVSSLDYTRDGLPRIILTKILTATSESARLYSTRFLRVLVRLQLADFHRWGIELLVSQLYDKSRSVSLAALDVLDEACELRDNLASLVNVRPSLLHLGDRGLLLLVRFLSLTEGFKFLSEANFVANELERWKRTFNEKYVRIVEDELNESLTRHQRGKDGNYGRRTTQRHTIHDVFVPHHLYAQLAQHKAGLDLLREKNCISLAVDHIRQHKLDTAEQVMKLKAALWALGHMGSSEEGVILMNDEHVIPDIVKLTEECPVYSVRGTCFFVLGLLATTRTGSDFLGQLGWESLRRSRHEHWPPVEEPDLLALDDCLLNSSLDSTGSQHFPESEVEDAYGGTLRRLDEYLDNEGRKGDEDFVEGESSSDSRRHPRAHFVLDEFDEDGHDEGGGIGGGVDNKNVESPRVDTKNGWLREAPVVLRKNAAQRAIEAVTSSPIIKISKVKPRRKWSNTLPLIRGHWPTSAAKKIPVNEATMAVPNCVPNCAALMTTMVETPRQRSRSVTQRPAVSEAAVEAWERRSKLYGFEAVVSYSLQCSPRGSAGLRARLKIGGRSSANERSRSLSFTESSGTGLKRFPVDLSTFSSTAYSMRANDFRGQLKSTSHVEIGHKNGFGAVTINGPRMSTENAESSAAPSRNETILKDRRYDSNESSRTSTSKSRSDSCTESTSGFSSCESGTAKPMELRRINDPSDSLRPQSALSASIAVSAGGSGIGHTVHYSDVTRKMVNLRNTPIIVSRVSTPRNLVSGCSPMPTQQVSMHSLSPELRVVNIDITSCMYATTRDAQGYATLRSLQQRRRGFSTCVPPDSSSGFSQTPLDSSLRSIKARSLDSRLEFPRFHTYDSLNSLGVPYIDREPSVSSGKDAQKIDSDDRIFVGICLPVDIAMIFNEDATENQSRLCLGEEAKRTTPSTTSLPTAGATMRCHMESDPDYDENVDDGLELHRSSSCFGRCNRRANRSRNGTYSVDSVDRSDIDLLPSPQTKDTSGINNKFQNSSEASNATTPASVLSVNSFDPGGGKGVDVDSFAGKSLIRKEVIRFIVNLSSSVATKSAEQGLLNLKQKFPAAFHDLCLYMEVCLLMAQYNFRLTARRFIQELFLDMTFDKLYEEAFQILKMPESTITMVKRVSELTAIISLLVQHLKKGYHPPNISR